MTAVSVERAGTRADGKQVVQAVILSDTSPAALPTTGKDITGMDANQVFAPFSVLYVVGDAGTKVYVTDESGVFKAQ